MARGQFSLYVWNERLTLEVARRLKAEKPNILIIFGGPQVPDRSEAFLRAHPFVDVACHGEGEQTFLKLIDPTVTEPAVTEMFKAGELETGGANQLTSLTKEEQKEAVAELAKVQAEALKVAAESGKLAEIGRAHV